MNRSNLVTTRAGIVIGGHYLPPPNREPGTEAEHIQEVLLTPSRPLEARILDWIDENPGVLAGIAMAIGAVWGLGVKLGLL